MIHMDWDTQVLKKESHPKVQKKGAIKVRNPNLLVIIVVRKDILLMYVGERLQIKMSSLRAWFTTISAIRKVIRHMNAKPKPCTHKDLKDIATTVRSMDIELLNADPNHVVIKQENKGKEQWQLL